MKKMNKLFLRVAMLIIAIMGTVNATFADEITVGDVSNSDCSQITRAESVVGHAMLRLTRSEIGLVGELRDFRVNCGYGDVNVFCEEDGQSLTIVIDDGAGEHMMDCSCPINIYFTLFNVKQDEFQLKVRGMSERNVGTISLKGHTMVEIDLTTQEILYDESFEYHLKAQNFRASSISDYEPPKDVSQRLIINHESETVFTCAYKKYVLPLDYSYLDVNATLDDDSTLVINVLTDGVPDKNGKRTGELFFNIVNSFRDAYHLRVNQTILLGSENEQTTCIYEGDITVPLHEETIIPLAPTSTGFYIEPLWYYIDLFTKTASVQPSDTYNSLSSIVIMPSIELWGINCTVDKIEDNAFSNLTDLESITIPEGVREIGQEAFLGCTGLTSVSFPSSLISIGDYSFRNCKGLTSVTLPDGLTSIGHGAFYNCPNLKEVDIPASVTNIDDDAFAFCQNLEDVYCRATTPPYTNNSRQFRKGNPEATLHVPAASLQIYKETAPWRDFKYIVPIETQEAYRPMIEDGKVWTYHYYNDFRGKEFYESLTVNGDTVINNKSYKKIVDVATGRVYCALREEGRKVYVNYPNHSGESLLYDFGLNVGDAFPLNEGSDPSAWATVVSVDTIVVGNRSFRALDVRPNDAKEWPNWWVEGIGGMYHLTSNFLQVGNFYYFSSCQIGGDTLFTCYDFQTLGTVPSPEKVIPMVQEGRTWNVVTINPADPAETDPASYYDILGRKGRVWNRTSYVIDGDTVIGGVTYKKLLSNGNVVCGMREENGRVYGCGWSWAPSSEHLLYDFNAQPGDVFKNDDENIMVQVKCVRQVNINGQSRRCLEMHHYVVDEKGEEHYGGFADYWIEGIGSTGYPDNPFWWDVIGNYPLLLSCYDGDKCIFNIEDFNSQTAKNSVDDIAYRPFVEEDKVWKVGSTTGISDGIVKMVDYYYFDGDTIINGKTCKQMMCQRFVSPKHPDYAEMIRFPLLRYVGAWYEEDKKVYISKQFRMMYDFSIDANDTLRIDNALPCVIGPKQTGGLEGFKGVYRDVMSCWEEELIYNTTWLEGVGGIEGPILNIYYGEEGHALFLMSCTVGDEVIYLNDEYEDGATPEGARKDRIDFTHTIKIRPKAPIKREKSDVCISSAEREVARPKVKAPKAKAPRRSNDIPSVYGEYNDLQLGINLNPLDDAYQVTITDESGLVVYEKTVDAGNIVGLSIDISAYAKGRYIVTVENSDESFTGEFETQTSGISDAARLNDKGKKIKDQLIYNLQGQRLNSLQKGLNIVNGRKVVIK